MSIGDPPINERLAEEATGKPRLSWILFFQNLLQGDRGNGFVPAYANLTAVGTPVIAGAFYQNSGWTDFWIEIVPGTSTTSTSGVTYFELPFDVKVGAPVFATVNGAFVGAGAMEITNNRIYTPSWSAVTVPITLSGRVLTQ